MSIAVNLSSCFPWINGQRRSRTCAKSQCGSGLETETALPAALAAGVGGMNIGRAWEPAYKPGSVWDSHSSGTYVAVRLERPTREHARAARRSLSCMSPYLVLLRVGFTLPPTLPSARCALTAPFHPYRIAPKAMSAVSFLWHFPWTRAPQALPGTLPCGARTFLHAPIPDTLPRARCTRRSQRGGRVGDGCAATVRPTLPRTVYHCGSSPFRAASAIR